jgi:hypothetical protein
MTRLEGVAAHMAERPTGCRPQVCRFVGIQRGNMHPAVAGEASPLPPARGARRDCVGMSVRPGRRQSAAARP